MLVWRLTLLIVIYFFELHTIDYIFVSNLKITLCTAVILLSGTVLSDL